MREKTEIGRFEKLCNVFNRPKVFLTTVLLLYIAIEILLLSLLNPFLTGKSRNPKEEHLYLQEDFQNAIIDNQYIDIEKLSDKDIEYEISYSKSNFKTNGAWDVVLERDRVQIRAKVTKSLEDNLLSTSITGYYTKINYNLLRVLSSTVAVIVSLVISLLIKLLIIGYIITISEYLVNIERKYINSKKSNSALFEPNNS